MMMTKNGVVNRQRVSEISVIGRATQGVKLMNLDDGDIVVDVARVIVDEENGDAEDLDGEGSDDVIDAEGDDVVAEGDEPEDDSGEGS